jgi:hypothetical protein
MGRAKLARTHGLFSERLSLLHRLSCCAGYICNEPRRFYIYVANRVSRIRLFSKPSQCHFIRRECNPADVATRSIDAAQLDDSTWLRGLYEAVEVLREYGFKVVDPDQDK